MSDVRAVAVAVTVILAACTIGDEDIDHERRRAVEFAVTADRALVGTVYEGLGPSAIADAVVAVCRDDGDFDAAVLGVVAGLPGSGTDADDDLVAVEVVVAGIVEVCPERVAVEWLPPQGIG